MNAILHIDETLGSIISAYGCYTYIFIFIVIFCETGLVVTPFLPGDSLIFAIGAFASPSQGKISLVVAALVLITAAIIGDSVNYEIGRIFGEKLFQKDNAKILKKEYLEKTGAFYEKHGSKAIIFARFVPIIRTLAPFVAGMGKMKYRKFLTFNVIGSLMWVSLFLFAGYFFGSIEFIKNNFEYVIYAIILISLLPIIITYFTTKIKAKKL